jgi:prepilin-type N-terminal cleavage/methylation domain-containing protein
MSIKFPDKLKHHLPPSESRGFTMMEVIAILVILGILSGIAITRLSDTGARDTAAANTLKAHLRYAQLRAMGDIVPWGIEIEAGKYTLKKDGDDAPVNLPGENSFEKSFEKTSVTSGTGLVGFSAARGQPTNSNGDLLSSDLNITLGSRTITITPETGFIE